MKQLLNWDKYDIETKKFYDYDFFLILINHQNLIKIIDYIKE
jgi:hypothetical protein